VTQSCRNLELPSAIDLVSLRGMKFPVILALLAVAASGFTACSTPEERHKREAARAKEDAQYDAERKARNRRHDEEDYHDYLVGYAHRLGKAVSELTSAERAEARREYENGEGAGHHAARYFGYGPGYWGW
jgi:hypothetical protein